MLHELYLLPLRDVGEGRPGRVDHVLLQSHRRRLCVRQPVHVDRSLRNQWGFQGYVQSDFGATHSTALSLNAGEDFEMQSGTFYSTTRINAALADSSLSMATIDRALTRRYVQMFKFGIFDRPITHTPIDAATAQAHGAVARSIGEQVAVLLKNQGNLLPLPIERAFHRLDRSTDVCRSGGGRRWRQLTRRADLHGHTAARAAERADRARLSATVKLVIVTNNNSNLADATCRGGRRGYHHRHGRGRDQRRQRSPEPVAPEQPGCD